MINKHSLRPSYCLNDRCGYFLNAKNKKNVRDEGRWTLFKRSGDVIVHRCASCNTFHEYDVKTGKLQMVDNSPKKAENESKPVPKADFDLLMAKIDANKV